jgi:hypothetical protein
VLPAPAIQIAVRIEPRRYGCGALGENEFDVSRFEPVDRMILHNQNGADANITVRSN